MVEQSNVLPFDIAANILNEDRLEVTALTRDGEQVALETYGIGSGIARRRVAKTWAENAQLCNGKAVTVEAIERELQRKELAARAAIVQAENEPPDETQAGYTDTGERKQPSQSTVLLQLAQDAVLFHDAEDKAYATIPVGKHRETWPLHTKGFRQWLGNLYYRETGKAANAQAIQDTLNTLSGKACFDSPQIEVHVRVAGFGDSIWIDIGDAEWRTIKITADGWQVMENPPVKFLRPRGMLPLAIPVSGGSINELRPFLNVESDADWRLIVSLLVAALRPTGPYPVLALHGEAGSGKSVLARILSASIDPNSAPLRAEPREVRDLMIAARNSWLLCFDNLSFVKPWLSNALCRLATGGGFATRELYTDAEEMIFDSQRPILLTGISELTTRGDLADRAITITLPPIPDDKRRPEDELWREFEAVHPRILGALLNVVSVAMRDVDRVSLNRLPRMADFAKWSAAAAAALGWTADEFLDAYTGNREASVALSIESAAIGPSILGLMYNRREPWEGTARVLLTELETDRQSDEKTRKRKDWPKSPRGMTGALQRLAPELRRVGIDVSWHKAPDRSRKRLVVLENKGPQPSEPSEPSENTPSEPETRIPSDGSGRLVDGMDVDDPTNRQTETCDSEPLEPLVDGMDDVDGTDPLFSGSVDDTCIPDGSEPDDCDRLEREAIMAVEAEAEAVDFLEKGT